MDVFVARQPIFDRERKLYGYELLFRSGPDRNEYDGVEPASATRELIANTLLTFGLDTITGGKKAFINFDRRLLLDQWRTILPKQTAVIELLETVKADPEVLEACRLLRDQGYILALDDFVRQPNTEPLTGLANIIKVDVRTTSESEQKLLLEKYGARGVELLAEKVETHEEFENAHRAGYTYFQGYFFARPTIMQRRRIPAAKATCLRLLQAAHQPDLDFGHIEEMISQDVSFSYNLLRFVNSALFYCPSEIHSLSQALLVLGEPGIRRWIALATLPRMTDGKPMELATYSLVRARFCERMAELAGIARQRESFLMGLFSLLDALIDLPLEDALKEVGLAPEIMQTLLGTASERDALANVYRLACRYEGADWDAVEDLARGLGLKVASITHAYLEATQWATQLLAAVRN